jgi:hypothetical protein
MMRERDLESVADVERAMEQGTKPAKPVAPNESRWRVIGVRLAVGWLAVALVFWGWALVAGQPIQLLYPFLWLGLVGLPVWRWRRGIKRAVQAWRAPGLVKFMALGYLMVLMEESFAALVNNLSEGFSWPLYFVRVGQFWAFNLLAFTGMFVGWYVLVRWVGYSRVEVFFLAGVYGLIGERVLLIAPTQPLLFALFAPLTVFTYGLIITPAMLSVPQRAPRWPKIARYPLGIALPYLCAVPPVALLAALRIWQPGLFPPRRFIP